MRDRLALPLYRPLFTTNSLLRKAPVSEKVTVIAVLMASVSATTSVVDVPRLHGAIFPSHAVAFQERTCFGPDAPPMSTVFLTKITG